VRERVDAAQHPVACVNRKSDFLGRHDLFPSGVHEAAQVFLERQSRCSWSDKSVLAATKMFLERQMPRTLPIGKALTTSPKIAMAKNRNARRNQLYAGIVGR
jgi:hypothetical protein